MPTDRDDDFDTKGRSSISDIMKKALFAGIGAVFMTEESVRGYVSEAKLPREIRNYIIQNTTQAKEQFFGYLSKEISQLVMKSDLPKVVQKFLADHTIEVEAKIRFRSNGTPEVSGGARASPVPIVAGGHVGTPAPAYYAQPMPPAAPVPPAAPPLVPPSMAAGTAAPPTTSAGSGGYAPVSAPPPASNQAPRESNDPPQV